MNEQRRWRVGVIGLGTMGRRIAAAMHAHPRFAVVLGFDPRFRSSSWFSLAANAEQLVSDDRVECVYVATPPKLHERCVELAVAAGKPLFCEKPLAPSVEAAERCTALVAQSAAPSAVNFPFATATNIVKLGELVHDNSLGTITGATLELRFARWPREWQRAGSAWLDNASEGGFMREVGSHFVFAMQRMFGASTVRSAHVERSAAGLEQRVFAQLRSGTIDWTIRADIGGDDADYNRLEVVGTRGRAIVRNWYHLAHPSGIVRLTRPDGLQLDALADLLDGNTSPLASFAEATAVVRTIEGILHA